jgi:DnaJ-class molecular chaperone
MAKDKKIEQIIERSIHNKNKNNIIYQKLNGLRICKFCGGSGEVTLNPNTGETKPCPKCGGSGFQG